MSRRHRIDWGLVCAYATVLGVLGLLWWLIWTSFETWGAGS